MHCTVPSPGGTISPNPWDPRSSLRELELFLLLQDFAHGCRGRTVQLVDTAAFSPLSSYLSAFISQHINLVGFAFWIALILKGEPSVIQTSNHPLSCSNSVILWLFALEARKCVLNALYIVAGGLNNLFLCLNYPDLDVCCGRQRKASECLVENLVKLSIRGQFCFHFISHSPIHITREICIKKPFRKWRFCFHANVFNNEEQERKIRQCLLQIQKHFCTVCFSRIFPGEGRSRARFCVICTQ